MEPNGETKGWIVTSSSREIPRSTGARHVPRPKLDDSRLSSVAGLKSRLFEDLGDAELAKVVASAAECRFPAASVVVNQGDAAERLFLVIAGCARYFFITPDGRKILLLWLPPGSICGGSSLLSRPGLYLVGTETVKDSCLLVWQRNTIRRLTTIYPQLLENALSIASDYLTWYVAAHVSVSCDNARRRLADVLVSLAHGIGNKVPGGLELEITNEQLANAANVTLFTASRLLSEWQRSRSILKQRGKVVLCSPQLLYANASQSSARRRTV
jgi:CRP-like cAMP-binding protein